MSQQVLALSEDLGQRFIRLLANAVDLVGLKQAAGDLDVAPSQLSNALAGRNNHHVHAEWIPWILRHDKTGEALQYLADLCGQDLKPKKKLTKAERDAAFREAVEQAMGPDIVAGLEAKADRIAARREP